MGSFGANGIFYNSLPKEEGGGQKICREAIRESLLLEQRAHPLLGLVSHLLGSRFPLTASCPIIGGKHNNRDPQ